MKAIVVKRKLLPSEVEELNSLLPDEISKIKIFSSVNISDKIDKYISAEYRIDDVSKKNLNYDVFAMVNGFGDKKIGQNSVAKLLTIGKSSVWHYNKFRIYFQVLDYIYELNEIKYYSESFENVQYFTSNKKLIPQRSTPENVNIRYNSEKNGKKLSFTLAFKYLLFIKLKIIRNIFSGLKLKHNKHVIIDHSQKQICIDQQTLKEIKGNYNLNYLFDKINNDFVVINEEVLPKFNTNKKHKFLYSLLFKKKNYKEYAGEIILLKAFFKIRLHKELKNNKNYLNDIYREIELNISDSFERLIFNFLISFHKSSIYYLFRYHAYSAFFKKHNFKTVSATDENSPVLKSIIDAAKQCNITTFGIQHGNIHDLHPAYMFTEQDRINRIMTDYTFIWGNYYKQFLADRANYNLDSLITVGQIRTDIIPKLLHSDIRKFFSDSLAHFELKGKKIILFASQPQRDAELRYRSAFDVFIAAKDIQNSFLIIKLHPGEASDIEYYESIAQKAGCTNYKIIYYFDLYLLLALSDIVITCFSTVGSEAVYFHKPLVILDHLKQDIQNYYKNKVAFQAVNAVELKEYIDRILNGDLSIDIDAYDKFIENYAFKIDGKVSQRYIDFLKGF